MNSPENGRPRLHLQAQLSCGWTVSARVDDRTRRLMRSALGLLARPTREKEWIAFLFYHWVLDDEREAFRRQLQFLRRFGEFITLEHAVAALQCPAGIGGRFFCMTFDDGFRNWLTNAVPILIESNVPAAFFLPTKYIGLDLDADWEQIAPFYRRSWSSFGRYFEFLNWDECRQIAAAGFTIGSHTHSHPRLTNVRPSEAEVELSLSKRTIEAQLGLACRHFCCPWGKAGRDFDPALHPDMARRLGYASFLTTEGGLNLVGQSPFAIRRSGTDPDLGLLDLRYGLFPSWCRTARAHFT